jgi:hypothetical protein
MGIREAGEPGFEFEAEVLGRGELGRFELV